MNRLLRYVLVFMHIAALSACATGHSHSFDSRPAWIDSPGNGVSASAGMHIRGRAAQEELAIERARVEYAKRFGVSIDSNQIITTNIAYDRASTVGASVAKETSRQVDIKARVKAKWLDEETDELWVWLVPSDQ